MFKESARTRMGLANQVTYLGCTVFAMLFCLASCTKEGDIRLMGSADSWQGRVEIFHNNSWGTICDDYWDLREGQVICRQLGLPDAIRVYSIAAFGEGSGPIWLDNVRCNGTEAKITDCPSNGWGVHNCKHYEDGGVACVHPDTNPTNPGSCSFDVDLCGYTNAVDDDFDWTRHSNSTPSYATGPTHDHTTGYGSYIYIETSLPRVQGEIARIVSPEVNGIKCVQFFYHMRGETVCELSVYIDDGSDRKMVWTKKGEASPVWEKAVIPVKGYSSFKIVFDALVGTSHTGDIAIDDVRALASTANCGALVPSDAKPKPPDLSKFNSTVRLVGGNVSSAGRIEVFHNSRWGTVCGSHFHLPAAKVVCRQLGFVDVETIVPCCSIHKPGKGIIWLDNLHCEGREASITLCPHKGWGATRCVHRQDAGVICRTKETGKQLRLAGSKNSHEGRVEIQIGGIWGTIMDIGWDIFDSTVVCRQLGFNGATAAYSSAHFGVGKGPIWLSSARCLGNETSFSQCNVTQHQIQWNHQWWWWNPHRHDASAECYKLRLAGGKSKGEGLVEILFLGTWGTICNENFDNKSAQVICREMGYTKVVSTKLEYAPKPSSYLVSPIITRLQCKGDEVALGLCVFVPLLGTINTCTHANDVVIKCDVPGDKCVPESVYVAYDYDYDACVNQALLSPTVAPTLPAVPTASTAVPTGPYPYCDINCPNCKSNSRHGGVCVCQDNKDSDVKCDVTVGVNVFEFTLLKLTSLNDFQLYQFQKNLAAQLNKYCKANSCGNNINSSFTADEIIIVGFPQFFNKQLNLQFAVFVPPPVFGQKTFINQGVLNNMVSSSQSLGGYSVMVQKSPKTGAQTGSSSTAKIVVPIVVILVVIGVVVVVFFIYRKKMIHGSGSGGMSQRYLHLARDDREDQDDPLLTMDDEDVQTVHA